MSTLLLVIDVQNGFINEQSSWLPAKLAEYIKSSNYTDVFATKFVNNTESSCYKFLNWSGCMTAQECAICSELDGLYSRVFTKSTYTCVTDELLSVISNYDEIHLVGISTTCCVVATAYDLFDRGYNIKVIPELCSVIGTFKGFQEAGRYMLTENVPCIEI